MNFNQKRCALSKGKICFGDELRHVTHSHITPSAVLQNNI